MANPFHSCDDVEIRFLALDLGPDGAETYQISFRLTPGAALRNGRMRHRGGASWELAEEGSTTTSVSLGTPDDVFRLALGERVTSTTSTPDLRQAAPHWPTRITSRLARRRLSGPGTIAFDAAWLASQLATSAFDRPVLFPGATRELDLRGLERASAILGESPPPTLAEGVTRDQAFAQLLRRALQADATSRSSLGWDGEGRLIGEHASGDLTQIGTDIGDGCEAALGSGPHHVRFDPTEPLGVGLGPLVPRPPSPNDDDASVGMGVEVGEVDPGGAAERAGVREGMVLVRLSEPDFIVGRDVPFEAALDEIDARRAAGRTLVVTFDTATPVRHLYAVEMPAAATLTALATARRLAVPPADVDVDVGAALNAACGSAMLWREETPRLFWGEAGSVTCAHTDICPQLELAHGLVGSKVVGIASHDATPRLLAEHGSDEDRIDEDATRVPTDRPLTPRQTALLTDHDVTLVLLQPGDLAIFDSGALHFASNAAHERTAALYHGAITPAAVPRLRLAAQAASGATPSDGTYRDHLHAAELLRIVTRAEARSRRRD